MFVSISESARAQYDDTYVSMSSANINGDPIHVVKMSRKDNHIKVKYFVCKEKDKSVPQRYYEWAKNKNIIAFSAFFMLKK